MKYRGLKEYLFIYQIILSTMDLEKLARFLVKAKKNTYASANKMNIETERPLHNELEFSEEEFYYRDSYVGFFQAPGMEEVRLGKNGETIWTMAYSGGMLPEYQEISNIIFAKKTFTFLKKALSLIEESKPYRGPEELIDGDWKYECSVEGNLKRFKGHEKIFYKNKEIFNQDFIGGIVLDK